MLITKKSPNRKIKLNYKARITHINSTFNNIIGIITDIITDETISLIRKILENDYLVESDLKKNKLNFIILC